jgi:hypothetical protein
LVCSDARVASILNPRSSGCTYWPLNPLLNVGLRSATFEGEFCRVLLS